MPKVSIVIPSILKSEALLKRAIDSVFLNEIELEVIVINDNPSISLEDLKLKNRYLGENVKFFFNSGKKGAGGARNFGVSKATSELITFLDDDDFLLPGRIDAMYSAYKMHEKDGVVLLSTGRIYEYNNYQEISIVKGQKFGLLQQSDIFVHNQIDIGFMVSKALFEKLNGFDVNFTNLEDWDFIIRALGHGNAFKAESFSYVVKNDHDSLRVSNNDYLGLHQLANKHKDVFGNNWYYKIKTQEFRSKKELSILKCLYFSFKVKSLYALKNYIASWRDRLL